MLHSMYSQNWTLSGIMKQLKFLKQNNCFCAFIGVALVHNSYFIEPQIKTIKNLKQTFGLAFSYNWESTISFILTMCKSCGPEKLIDFTSVTQPVNVQRIPGSQASQGKAFSTISYYLTFMMIFSFHSNTFSRKKKMLSYKFN